MECPKNCEYFALAYQPINEILEKAVCAHEIAGRKCPFREIRILREVYDLALKAHDHWASLRYPPIPKEFGEVCLKARRIREEEKRATRIREAQEKNQEERGSLKGLADDDCPRYRVVNEEEE